MPPRNTGLTNAQQSLVSSIMSGQQTQTKWNAYFSRVRISATSLNGDFSYTAAQGQISSAFAYARGQDMAAAGLPGVRATAADTNIVTANQTISGELLLIEGIGIILETTSDANFAKALDPNVSVIIKTNSTTEYLLGIPSMIPGPGGLFGAAESISTVPALNEQVARQIGVLSNGIPHTSNFFPLPEPMLWTPSGRGDSNLNVNFTVERAATTIAQWSSAARAAGTGVAAYVPPTAAQVFCDFMVILIGQTANPLSSN